MAADLLAKEDVIRACVEERGAQRVTRDIGTVLFNQQNIDALLAIIGASKQTVRRAGLAALSTNIRPPNEQEGLGLCKSTSIRHVPSRRHYRLLPFARFPIQFHRITSISPWTETPSSQFCVFFWGRGMGVKKKKKAIATFLPLENGTCRAEHNRGSNSEVMPQFT